MTTLYLDCETLPLGTLAHLAAGLSLTDPPAGWTCPEPPPYEPAPFRPGNAKPGGVAYAERQRAHEEGERRRIAEYERDHDPATWPILAAAAEWEARRAWSLRASRAELACVAYAVDDDPVTCADGGYALRALDEILRDSRVDIVAWNAGFDAAMLMVAAFRASMPVLAGRIARYPYQVVAARKLYGGPQWLDCADLWPVVRGDGEGSQETVARVLGVAREHPIRGVEVFDAVVTGRLEDVRTHCAADVEELRDIHRILWQSAQVRR